VSAKVVVRRGPDGLITSDGTFVCRPLAEPAVDDDEKRAVEFVAQALHKDAMRRVGVPPWNKMSPGERSGWRHQARVAIKAMAEYGAKHAVAL